MNKTVDFYIAHVKDIERAVNYKREDSGGSRPVGVPTHSFISDPTFQKAAKRLMPVGTVEVYYLQNGLEKRRMVRNAEIWIKAVNYTWAHFKDKVGGKLMTLRYSEGIEDMKVVAGKLDVSIKRAYVILDDVHRYCANYGGGLGAIIRPRKMLEIKGEIRGVRKKKS